MKIKPIPVLLLFISLSLSCIFPCAVSAEADSSAGTIGISEVMSKNRGTICDRDGTFPDWIELFNGTGTDLNLEGWYLLKNDKTRWTFPDFTFYADSHAIVFASKKDRCDSELHASFAVSSGDSISLYNSDGLLVSSCILPEDKADYSFVQDDTGNWSLNPYPTPGYENTPQGYEYFMNSRTAEGPLVINEVCVDNFTSYYQESIGYPDWVEIMNISNDPVDLSQYSLSDDTDRLGQFFLSGMLSPGSTLVVLCDKDYLDYTGGMQIAPFSLNSENEQIFLSTAEGRIIDYASLHEIPYRGTYGRVPGQNGFYYLYESSPSDPNGSGERRVSSVPSVAGRDGVYSDVQSVVVELHAPGDIYYTLDSSAPTSASLRYTGPLTVTETTVIRAISIESGALPSRPLTLNYFLNEGHSLPVVSLVADDQKTFSQMYLYGRKDLELPGNVSFYSGDDSFSLGCGIKMHGDTSLVLSKKNMSLRFRGSYGAERLYYDLFDGGVTSFSNLLLRAGQDQNNTIVRNEVCHSLALDFSDDVITGRYQYCVLYLNGQYNGIYAFMEKPNEDMVATQLNVDKDAIEMEEASVYSGSLYYDVINFMFSNDISDSNNFAYVAEQIDLNSLIDWSILEAYFSNYDLASGNLRYARDTENAGKWKLLFYDLDCSFYHYSYSWYNVLSFGNQISYINTCLLGNDTYREMLLSRASEAYHTVLTEENLLARIDSLVQTVAPEVPRDATVSGMSQQSWQSHINDLKTMISNDWTKINIDVLCQITHASPEEKEMYFGDLLK